MSATRVTGDAARRPKALKEGLIVREVGGETLLYDTRRHKMHCLGPLVARVWRACTGRRTLAQVAESVSSGRGRAADAAAVELALLRLRRARLVARDGPPAGTLARRELLQRAAGLAGLGVLTLAAPTVLQAATCTPFGVCRSLPNSSCTGLPCCASPDVLSGETCGRRGNGPNCDCRRQ
ncbi:MAG: hypothetical protein ACM3PV_15975 [Betaproteobacteria bacterium]